ncbi:hypothetical protein QWZ13_03815 [Reinekea marina]|nr:hypothetical protein [Reinekea marina]MDN3648029.1 hypothetical protein [Reinekea marina]
MRLTHHLPSGVFTSIGQLRNLYSVQLRYMHTHQNSDLTVSYNFLK